MKTIEDNGTATTREAALPDIMHYESDIWSVADLLIAASVKQSDFPAYMMPFFALMMLEGRMRNAVRQVEAEYGITAKDSPDEFREMFQLRDCGFNEYIVMQGKTLAAITANDTTFSQDFHAYLKAFDPELKKLLGVEVGASKEKFLNMDGIAASLDGKGILLSVAKIWAAVDLSPYDNSAITTLEEHIKRKWADISASTAGEQFTPDDIISLIAEIVAEKMQKPKGKVVHLYDPTCGGANLLFGVEDRLREKSGYKHVASYGSEYNDALYALAAIESRFREFSRIEYGNTLTRVPFSDTQFDGIVANPPYGTPWKGFASEIENDQRGQFPAGLPSTSDGQLLFMQHILWQLDAKGVAVVVADGSTLFSGDAGGAESNIRKYVFDRDWVETIVQLPQQEFFNTGITTYLWIFNKDKAPERRDLVALIDASKCWVPLRKSKGDKRREMDEESRRLVVRALHDFAPSDICKIFPREHFYYNKQAVVLTETDEDGKALAETAVLDGVRSVRFPGSDWSCDTLTDLEPAAAAELLARLKAEPADAGFELELADGTRYAWDAERRTVVRTAGGKPEALGCGALSFALKTSRGRKSVKVTLGPMTTKDWEIVPHRFDEAANAADVAAFVKKYIFKPCTLGENKVGVEINFNQEFYVPEKIESVEDVLAEIKALDRELEGVKL